MSSRRGRAQSRFDHAAPWRRVATEGRRAGQAGGLAGGLTTGRPFYCPVSPAAGPRLGRVGAISVRSLHSDSLGDGGAGK